MDVITGVELDFKWTSVFPLRNLVVKYAEYRWHARIWRDFVADCIGFALTCRLQTPKLLCHGRLPYACKMKLGIHIKNHWCCAAAVASVFWRAGHSSSKTQTHRVSAMIEVCFHTKFLISGILGFPLPC